MLRIQMQLVQSSNPCGVVKLNFSTVLSTVKTDQITGSISAQTKTVKIS